MRKNVLASMLAGLLALFFTGIAYAQPSKGGVPKSFFISKTVSLQNLTSDEVTVPAETALRAMDEEDAKNGVLRRIGRSVAVNYTPQNSGTWDVLPDGGKIWRLKLHLNGAKAVGIYYNQFYLPFGSELFLYNENKTQILGAYTSENNPVYNTFANELVEGETVTLEYYQPASVTMSPSLSINELAFIYRDYEPRFDHLETRDFGDSDASCEVNVNCSEGTAWQSQKRAVVRILVKEGASFGWCSGTLMNNTAQNCTPYILTADHCSGNGVSTTADLTQWIFYFNYEAPSCTNPAAEGTLASKSITGCTLKARAGMSGSIGSTSDFYFVQMTTNVPTAWNPFYAGWSRVNATSPSGVGIHHPAGDIKKISTYTTSLIADKWTGGTINGTHWRVTWAATANGHGVTEGGSSGSGIFDNNGRLIGQLSGGSSFCTALTSPDLYGAFWYDWDQNTSPATNNKLKPWLDPGNTGVTTLNGTNAPCGPSAPVADFVANTTTPCIGSTVTFTDLSTGTPTSWAWSFSPTTVTYVGGTTAASQNPQVQFNAAGPYTVTLTATNGLGSDPEVKTNYITPTTAGTLPFVENFEAVTFPPAGWSRVSADGAGVAWGTDGIHQFERRPAAGNTGSAAGSAAVNNFNYNTDTTQTDNLLSKPISLAGATSPRMTFKHAYKYYGSPYLDELRIFISSDCGATYGSAVYYKKGVQLATSGTLTTTFTPSVAADWDIDTVSLTPYAGQSIVVKFVVTNKYGNNVYIDDININNVAAVASVAIASNDADNTICAGTSVTFTATPTNGGTAPTYQWQVNGSNVGTGGPAYTTSGLTNGQVVTCIMTSNLPGVTGSPATSNAITMTVNAIPSAPTAGSNSPVCTGSAINLTATTVAGATYSWTGPSAFTATTQNPARPAATAAMAGTYSVTVTVGGCTSAAGITAVVVNAVPAAPTATASSPVCTGSTINLSSTTVAGATYSWTGPSAFTAATQNPARPSATTAMAGTYSVTVTVGGCTSAAGTATVVVNTTPAMPAAGSNTPVCAGSAINLTASTVAGATYSWAGPSTYTATTQNPALSPSTTAMAGTYSVTVTAAGCTSASATTTVVVNSGPSAQSTTTTSSACGSSTGTITLGSTAGGAPPYTYSVNGSGFTATTSYTGFAAGSYPVIVQDANGCQFSTTASLSNSSGPTAQATSTTSSTCGGTDGAITAGATTGGTAPYTYSVNGSASTATTSYSGFAAGTYPVVVTDANGCTFTTSATVSNTGTTPSTPTITQSGSVLTSGSATGSQWYLDGNPIAGETNQNYTFTANGTYTVIVTTGGCASAESAPVVIINVGIDVASNPHSLMVYPNPNDGNFTVAFMSSSKETFTIELTNTLGQVVYKEEMKDFSGTYLKQLSVVEFGQGVYTISLTNAGHDTVKKIVVY